MEAALLDSLHESDEGDVAELVVVSVWLGEPSNAGGEHGAHCSARVVRVRVCGSRERRSSI